MIGYDTSERASGCYLGRRVQSEAIPGVARRDCRPLNDTERMNQVTLTTDLAGANHKKTALWNRGLTVRLLRNYHMLSRKQLADMTGLRGSTLTYIVRDLLESKIVRITSKKKESKSVGKKQTLLELNPDFGWVAGFSVRPGSAHLVLLNSAGTVIDKTSFKVGSNLEKIPADLKSGLADWIASSQKPPGLFLGAGLSIPGVVDPDHGIVLRSAPFNAANIPLQEIMSAKFRAPVVIDHNASFGAGAEAVQGAAQGISNFLYFLVNHALSGNTVSMNSYGSALYLHDDVYRGYHYSAGEIDRVLEPPLAEISLSELTILATPDVQLTHVLIALAQRIGITIAALVNFIDVPLVILAGTVRISNERFIAEVQKIVEGQLVQIVNRRLTIVPTQVSIDPSALGAALAASDLALVHRQQY